MRLAAVLRVLGPPSVQELYEHVDTKAYRLHIAHD